MGTYLSKVTPYRPVFGQQQTLNESNLTVGEEIKETDQTNSIDEQVSNGQTNETTLKEDLTNHVNGDQINDEDQIKKTNEHSLNEHYSNGHHLENGDSITDNLNGQSNAANHKELDEDVNDEDSNEEESNDKLNKTDLKIKKDDKQYSNKKVILIEEEPEIDEDEFETVGKKRKGKRGAAKKQYKKRKNNLLIDLQRVNDIVANE